MIERHRRPRAVSGFRGTPLGPGPSSDVGVAQLQIFGPVRFLDQESVEIDVPPSLQPLLIRLALEESRELHRDVLLADLWPELDADRARRRLNTSTWRLRQLLPSGGMDVVGSGRLGLVRLALTIGCPDADQWIALRNIAAGEIRLVGAPPPHRPEHCGPGLDAIEAAVLLEPDRLAVGCYHDWVVDQREQLRLHGLRVLTTLVDRCVDAGDLGRALQLAEILIERDPLREESHRRLINLHRLCGRHREALDQFRRCEAILRDEIGVGPAPETVAAVADIGSSRCRCEPESLVIDNLRLEPSSETYAVAVAAAIDACRQAIQVLEVLPTSLAPRRLRPVRERGVIDG